MKFLKTQKEKKRVRINIPRKENLFKKEHKEQFKKINYLNYLLILFQRCCFFTAAVASNIDKQKSSGDLKTKI